MSSYILFDLPETLSRQILVEWLTLKHIAELDSAFCSSQLRPTYLSLAYGNRTTFRLGCAHYCRRVQLMITWTILRKVRLDEICMSDNLPCKADLLPTFLIDSGSALRKVCIYGYDMSDAVRRNEVLKVANCCPNVRTLGVHGGGPWGDCLPVLTTAFQRLTSLTLSNVKLSEPALTAALSLCKCLEQLYIRTDSEAVPINAVLPSLQSSDVSGGGVTNEFLHSISQNCPALRTLYAFQSSRFNGFKSIDVGVRAVLDGCTLLREADVNYARGISTELRAELAGRCNLYSLRLSTWWGLSDQLAQEVLKVSPGLTECDLSAGNWLTDATLAVCAQYCPLLETFVLWGCSKVTNHGVCGLVVTRGANLREVHLRDCKQLGDEAVLAIAAHCPLLESVTCPPEVSSSAVVTLVQACNKLVKISLTCCHKVTTRGVRAITKGCSSLTKVIPPSHLDNWF
jgi:hypothetical protein